MVEFLQSVVDVRYLMRSAPDFLAGAKVTLMLALVGLVAAFVWGGILVAPLRSRIKPLAAIARAYVEFMRNTPLLLQMYLLYFGLPMIGLIWTSFVCGVLSIALQHGAFLSDIFRAGIEAVSERQREAARALGMSRLQIYRLVVIPQGLLKMMGPITNQVVILIKDTSLVSAIGVIEITMVGKQLTEQSARTFEIFLLIAMLFLILTTAAGSALRFVESRYRRRL